ncbi:MAG: PCRF domain-containing protein [Actinobacteria bacterium]|nr:PCRF domain-containing protein [Actinomycetota bacterium]
MAINPVIDKIEYLEKNYDDIISSLLETGACSTYEKIKKDCGIKISMLDKLIDLGKKYKEVSSSIIKTKDEFILSDYYKEKDFIEKEIYSVVENESRDKLNDILLVISIIDENEDAGVFISDLSNMYIKFCQSKNLKTNIISKQYSQKGYIKEINLEVKGPGAGSLFKHEGGLHTAIKNPGKNRNPLKLGIYIQVLPYVDKKDIILKPSELKIEVYHSGGHGGQSVNTTDSAVRIVHLPTGLSAESQNERSQHQNKKLALKVLKAKLLRLEEERIIKEKKVRRNLMLFDYINKDEVRKYDYIKNIVFDYRLDVSFKNLGNILRGNMQDIMDGFLKRDEMYMLKEMFSI